MNRIFKVIWNKTTQRQEVVSELAKGAVKASSTSSSEKNNKTLSVSILATLITSILASSVSYAATINYNDIPKQGVAVVYDANSGILKHMSLEGTENSGVLSAVDATNSLNKMLDRYKGFFHVNAEGNKIGDEQANDSKYTENTGIWADWLTATASKVEAETKFSGGTFNDNLGKFTEKSGAQGSRSVAVGVYANALAADSIAIGSRANVNNYWGNQYREALNGIAIGRQAQVEGATNSIAFGTNAKLLASTPYSLKPDNSIAIGNNSTVNWASNAITLGNNASITGSHAVNGVWKGSDNSIAIGNGATVQRENSIAIGAQAIAKNSRSIVIGGQGDELGNNDIKDKITNPNNNNELIDEPNNTKHYATANREASIVIGNGARSLDNGSYTIVMGGNAQARASGSIVMGDRAASQKDAAGAVTIGQNARSANAGDVVLGRNSKTEGRTLDGKYYDNNSGIQNKLSDDLKIGETNIGNKGTKGSNQGVVSVGSSSLKRQIQNVGAGLISETSTDAINGSQLYHVIKAADEIAKTEYKFQVNGSNIKTMSNKGTSEANNANNVLNFKAGYGLDVTNEGDAVIYKLNDDSKNSIIEAKNAATTVTNSLQEINKSVARAETAATEAGKSAQSAASAASAASNSATAADKSAQSAASAASAASNSATSAANSATSAASAASAASNSATAADNSAQSAASAASAASNSATSAANSATSAASAASAASNSATAANSAASAAQISAQRIEDSGLISKDGKTASAANNTSNRDSAKAKGKDATAVGYGSNASGENATALGNNSQASANNATAIGQNAKAKAENAVAIGQGSVANEKDTVSVGNDGSNGQPIVNRRITNVATPIHNTDAVNKQYVDNSVNSVRNELKQTDKKLRGGIAGAVAMANIPTVNRAGGTMIGLGVGNFKGQNAVAVGMSKSSDNNRIHFKVSGSATSAGDYAVGGGIGYQW